MIKDLEEAIGYHFQNISLLQNALAHSSYANERWHNSLLSNERLEFLGDAVLSIVVSDYIFRNCPHLPEGELNALIKNVPGLRIEGHCLTVTGVCAECASKE